MKTSHLIRIALPGALAAALLASQVSQAADLVPPPGYYAAVGERKGSAGSCPAVPPPAIITFIRYTPSPPRHKRRARLFYRRKRRVSLLKHCRP